jgi:hypothetical protein
MTIDNIPATQFTDRNEAQACADANNRDADGWAFEVRRSNLNPPRWVVECFDEEGELLGPL